MGHDSTSGRLTGFRAQKLGGAVGFFLATSGYTLAVITARTFVSLEAHCTQDCPVVRVQGFQVHHFHYGLIILVPSLVLLSRTLVQRARWDASLFLGIGAGLMADEAGFLFLGVGYDSPISFSVIGIAAGVLIILTLDAALKEGRPVLKSLDRADILTYASVALIMMGNVYFDRPFQTALGIAGALSWAIGAILLAVFGRKHFQRILKK